jgi:F-type H+-transporting ATPase subunit alpha
MVNKNLIGNKQTRKIVIIINTILKQKQINVQGTSNSEKLYCVYLVIRKNRLTVAQLVKIISKTVALKYRIIVVATTSTSTLLQLLAPYSSCVIREYF